MSDPTIVTEPVPASPITQPADGARPRVYISQTWILAGILVLATVLRFAGLSAQSLWIDELLSIYRARRILDLGFTSELWNSHGPLHFYVLAGVLPDQPTEFATRWPSALFGVALVWVTWLLGKHLFGRRVGLVAALLMAVSPYAIWYSQEARYGSLFMLLSALSLLFTYRFLEDGGARRLAAYVTATVLMLLSFVGGVFLVLAQNLWLLVARPSRQRLLGWGLGQILVVLVFVPWFFRAYEVELGPFTDEDEQEAGQFAVSELQAGYTRPTHLIQVGYVTFAFAMGYSLGPSQEELHRHLSLKAVRRTAGVVAAAVLLVACVGLAGAVHSWRLSRRNSLLLMLAVAFPILCAYAIASLSQIAYNVRYTASAFPPFMLLLAAGVVWCLERPRTRGWLAAGLGGVVLLSLANYYANPVYMKEDSRGAARILTDRRGHDEPLIVGSFIRPLEFYYGGSFYPWRTVELREGRGAAGRGVELPANRLWVVETRVWAKAGFRKFLERVQRCYTLEEQFDVTGYVISVYRARSTRSAPACTLVQRSRST